MKAFAPQINLQKKEEKNLSSYCLGVCIQHSGQVLLFRTLNIKFVKEFHFDMRRMIIKCEMNFTRPIK